MKVVAAVSAASEEMPSVLAVPVDELIIGLIAFLIVFGALGKFALPKIKATLDERADAIEGGLQRAEEAQAEASRVLEEYKEQYNLDEEDENDQSEEAENTRQFLGALQRGKENEQKLNQSYMRQKIGSAVKYGDVIQLLHLK
ncbi:MAG: ATP synthase F0 subunit B, partial [Candidatus Nanopelagicales bacterium]